MLNFLFMTCTIWLNIIRVFIHLLILSLLIPLIMFTTIFRVSPQSLALLVSYLSISFIWPSLLLTSTPLFKPNYLILNNFGWIMFKIMLTPPRITSYAVTTLLMRPLDPTLLKRMALLNKSFVTSLRLLEAIYSEHIYSNIFGSLNLSALDQLISFSLFEQSLSLYLLVLLFSLCLLTSLSIPSYLWVHFLWS